MGCRGRAGLLQVQTGLDALLARGRDADVGPDWSGRSSCTRKRSVQTSLDPVRSQAHTHSTVEVRAGVSQGPVAEGNCVVARRGGEQPEANWRSAGDELDSAWNDDELAGLWRSLEHIGHAVLACKAMTGSSAWLEVERWDVCVSEARRPVGRGVVGRSQSPGSTVSAMWWWGRVAGTSRRVWRAAPLPESNWIVRESRGHHKPRVGKRDRCGGGGRYLMTENASEVAGVAEPRQAASSRPEDWGWVDRSIWTDRMLAALGNGVQGGK